MSTSLVAILPQGDGMQGQKPRRVTDQPACHTQWTDIMDPVSSKVEGVGRL